VQGVPEGAPEDGVVPEGRAVDDDIRVSLGRADDVWLIQGHYLGSTELAPCTAPSGEDDRASSLPEPA
jgi:hypothetical protein